MSMKLDAAVQDHGTRFRIFAQPPFVSEIFSVPESICVRPGPDEIGPGPADDRMYVLDAINKTPYGQRPFHGSRHPPVEAGQDGHFDHLDPASREFSSAMMYATVRRVLDIWEDYFGRRIEWHFSISYDRLELIPLIEWDNAQSGYGFLEFGFGRTSFGGLDRSNPYSQNFDVLAHELGHSIIFSEIGIPSNASVTAEYGGFHESAGDLVALVASLHFHQVVDHLLASSKGNLFTINEIARIGELSKTRQIRLAFNYERMSTVTSEPHDLSKPLTGAIFDIFVEIFQKYLVARNLISSDLAERSFHGPMEDIDDAGIQAEFEQAYTGHHEDFKLALFAARDDLGRLLAMAWDDLSAHFLSYRDVGVSLQAADRAFTGGEHRETIRDCFTWREIALPEDSIAMVPRRLADYGTP